MGVPDLPRASHIKPWADCGTDAERLDIFNGLLLAPHLDAGFITVAEDGTLLLSDGLPSDARSDLGFDGSLKVRGLHRAHERYMPWHRSKIFRNTGRAHRLRRCGEGGRLTILSDTRLDSTVTGGMSVGDAIGIGTRRGVSG